MIEPTTSRISFPQRHPGMGVKGCVLLYCLLPVLVFAQNAGLHGRVTDTNNGPLAGVSVSLLNTGFNTVTDSSGNFRISNLPAGAYMIALSYVGFETLKKTLTLSAQETVTERFVLNPASHHLEEFTVTAPKQSRVMEAKSIAVRSVDIKDVIQQSTVLTDVADRLSGVRIRRSGSLGDRSDISINGVTGAAIRISIDGVPMEIAYPAYDLSTLPLSNIKRLDVYKGVVPVDIGTDAMGGAINIITEQKAHNSVRAGYYLGSFNTHMADLSLGLASKSNYFLNVAGAYNYSDNNYWMRAFVFEKNKDETVTRFHDAYQASFASLNFGAHSKKWADELRFFYNYSEGFKEVQNWARITTISLGEAEYRALNHSGGMRYEKRFDRLQLITLTENEQLQLFNLAFYSVSQRWVRLNLNTQTATVIDDIPATGSFMYPTLYKHKGKLYFQYYDGTTSGFYSYDPATNKARKVATVTKGGVASELIFLDE